MNVEFDPIHSQILPNMYVFVYSLHKISNGSTCFTTYIHLQHFYTYPVARTLPIPNLGYENNVMEAAGIDK